MRCGAFFSKKYSIGWQHCSQWCRSLWVRETCPPIFTLGGTSISMLPPMFEDFNLETACFSIQLIANAWIFSARNLRMSRSLLFSEQPASHCLNWLQVSLDWVQTVQYCTLYLYRRIGWVIFIPQDHCSCCKISNECIWSTLGQVKCDSVCGRCYVAVFQVFGNGVTWPNNFRFLCTRGNAQPFGKSYIGNCKLLIQNLYRQLCF